MERNIFFKKVACARILKKIFLFAYFCFPIETLCGGLGLYLENYKASPPFNMYPTIKFEGEYVTFSSSKASVTYLISSVRKIEVDESAEVSRLNYITLNEDLAIAFTNEADIEDCSIRYVRTFPDTDWHELFVPFSLRYEQWKDNFEIRSISGVKKMGGQYVLETESLFSGETLPNMPYLIRSKKKGRKGIVFKNTTLYATQQLRKDFLSVEMNFAFVGYYGTPVQYDDNLYTIAEDGFTLKKWTSLKLDPFRWYVLLDDHTVQFAYVDKMVPEISLQIEH